MQKARRHICAPTACRRTVSGTVSFLLFEVLFTFPSRYWSTIGLGSSLPYRMVPVDSRRIPRVPHTQDTTMLPSCFEYRTVTVSSQPSRLFFYKSSATPWFYNPIHAVYMNGLGSSSFARHYWGNHCYFLFLQDTKMFRFHVSSLNWMMISLPGYRVVSHSEILGIGAYLNLPVTYRSLSRPFIAPECHRHPPCPPSYFPYHVLRISDALRG